MDKKVIIFVTLRRLSLLHTVDNYNKQKSIQYITNVSIIEIKNCPSNTFFFKILNFLQLQILMNFHLVVYISWTELTNTDIKEIYLSEFIPSKQFVKILIKVL